MIHADQQHAEQKLPPDLLDALAELALELIKANAEKNDEQPAD